MTPNGEHQENGGVHSWHHVKILISCHLCESSILVRKMPSWAYTAAIRDQGETELVNLYCLCLVMSLNDVEVNCLDCLLDQMLMQWQYMVHR